MCKKWTKCAVKGVLAWGPWGQPVAPGYLSVCHCQHDGGELLTGTSLTQKENSVSLL